MPIQAPQWTDYLNCPACSREFSPRRGPVSLSCGHTLCRPCLKNLIRKQCPFDRSVVSEELVVNTALLQLMGYDPPSQPVHPATIMRLSEQDQQAYDVIVKSLEQLAVYLKYCSTGSGNMIGSRLSRPMQRKLVTLLQCSLMDEEGRGKAARAARSLGERTVSELLLQHQNPQQVSANLWAAVRSRGCQFLGPAMQEEVLKLVLLALEDGSPLSRKVLVMFVVQRLEPHFPHASKTSIGHVVQLLYRASCFKVSKRDSDSSLMQLKEEFRTYECLRREHDSQIVQIATESGLRMAPDQWSALLYGDTLHKSHMQSIIDKLQTPQSFAQSVQELFFTLQRTGDPAQLLSINESLDRLTNIDPGPDAISPNWQTLSEILTAVKEVVTRLVDYIQHHATPRDANHNLKNERLPDGTVNLPTIASHPGRYKVSMCRDAQARTFCPRGNNCTYAHSEEELGRYRRVDAPNEQPRYSVPPRALAPTPSVVPLPIMGPFNYPPPNYNGMRPPGVPPPGLSHRMPEMHNGLEHPRHIPYKHNNNANGYKSYANALVYGCVQNNQVRTNDGFNPQSKMNPPNGSWQALNGPPQMMHPNEGVTHNGISPPNMPINIGSGLSTLNGGIGHPNGMGPHNGSMPLMPSSPPYPLHVFNRGEYIGSFCPIPDGKNYNGGLPLPNHQPPADSRYFPRQVPEQTKNYQPQNDGAQISCRYQGMAAIGPCQNGAEVAAELVKLDPFGLETGSQFESSWPPPPIDAVPHQNMFMFNRAAKNLPKGINHYDLLPMGINLTSEQVITSSMQVVPGTSEKEVLDDLHNLAVKITSECSDSETE